jgi:N-acetyl-gamma-glutamylphosphate reductase
LHLCTVTCEQSGSETLRRYGGEHKAKELQKEAVYGLTELNREAIRFVVSL